MSPSEASPRRTARIAGIFYSLTIVFGAFTALFGSGRVVANLIATAAYAAVTILFYGLFKPVSPTLSLIAAIFSLAGCALGAFAALSEVPVPINPLAFFGVYCLLIGLLIFKSTFLPRILGVLMAIGGLGWLTFAFPSLASQLRPFNMLPGVLGETVLTVWLLAKGVNVPRWHEQASASKTGS
jgi:hypothetical protein